MATGYREGSIFVECSSRDRGLSLRGEHGLSTQQTCDAASAPFAPVAIRG
jgi:hypothetical protein